MVRMLMRNASKQAGKADVRLITDCSRVDNRLACDMQVDYMLGCHWHDGSGCLHAAVGSNRGSVAVLPLGANPARSCQVGDPSAILPGGHSETVRCHSDHSAGVKVSSVACLSFTRCLVIRLGSCGAHVRSMRADPLPRAPLRAGQIRNVSQQYHAHGGRGREGVHVGRRGRARGRDGCRSQCRPWRGRSKTRRPAGSKTLAVLADT